MNKDAMLRAFFSKPTPKCDCRICWPESQGFVLCPSCGCKRCPKATYHRHACTSSNDSGQVGSVYGETRCGDGRCKCVKFAAEQEAEAEEFRREFPNFGIPASSSLGPES
jgi:hypothetical protein